ncbi:MAG: ABC transporter permease [Bacteroidota bacterium]
MFKNYIKIAFRGLSRNKVFSFINIAGLALGMACCMLIFLYVNDELSYDKFQEKADRMHRVVYHASNGNDYGQIPPPISPLMTEYFPELEASARMYRRNASVTIPVENGEPKFFEETNIFFTDSTIAKIFTFDFIAGSPENMLKDPFTAIITDEVARRYFGDENALGKNILLQGDRSFEVVGVVKEYPGNSHLHFNILVPFDNMYDMENEQLGQALRNNFAQNWLVSHSHTYVLLKEGQKAENVNDKFQAFVDNYAPENLNVGQSFYLQPLLDIHLHSNVFLDPEPQGDIQNVYLFSVIAIITLLIACFNFVNLSTAQSLKRLKEVGMRKVLGARKFQLFGQFLGESILISLFAFILATSIVYLGIPKMNELTQKELEISALLSPISVVGFLLIFIVTGLLGGSYPAFHITRTKTLLTLKGKVSEKVSSHFTLRKILLVMQFSISLILITGTVIIYSQLDFMNNRPLGFKQEGVLGIPIFSSNLNNVFGGVNGEIRGRLNAFEEEVLSNPRIHKVTQASTMPGFGAVGRMTIPEGFDTSDPIFASTLSVDYDFVQTFGLEVLHGRDFNIEAGSDHLNAIIINESAVEEFKWGEVQDALGKTINLEGTEYNVIGIVKDFHFTSLRQPISAMLLHVSPAMFTTLAVELDVTDFDETIAFINDKWQEVFPEKTFEYTFLDDTIRSIYQTDNRLGSIIRIFTIFAILVSCLGAYGLIMFSARQKEKEIGVRKVLGASVPKIIKLLFKDFMWPYVLGLILAVPAVYYWGSGWLEEFNYHINIGPQIYLIGAISVLIIICLTISYQSIKAALVNPIQSLRDE